MNERIKKKWLRALRSGEYVQGKDVLCREGRQYDEFCCLGVLCDIYAQETGDAWSGVGELNMHGRRWILPPKVSEWAGLNGMYGENPLVGGKPLSDLNDDKCMSFPEIADRIEEHL